MKFYIVLVAIAAGSAWLCNLWYKNCTKCSTWYIDKTCEKYKDSTLRNDFCQAVCIENKLKIDRCLGSTTFNKTVFAATVNGREIILKINLLWFDSIENAEITLRNPDTNFNSTGYFTDIVSSYFGNNCPNCKKLVQKLLRMADSDKNGVLTNFEALWFASLIRTRENFMLAALNNTGVTVNFIAPCGALYAVEKLHIGSSLMVDTSKAFTDFWSLPEFAEPIESFIKDILGDLRLTYSWFQAIHEKVYVFIKRLRQDKVPTLRYRLKFILGTLKMLHNLASFQHGEMMWCDILYENVGCTNPHDFTSVKLTDLDEIFARQNVFQNVNKSTKECTKNLDCLGESYNVGLYYHQECSSYCQQNKKCSALPAKTNLAYLCESLFFDAVFNPVAMALSERGISKRLGLSIYGILTDCLNSTATYTNLENYLVDIVGVARKVTVVLNTLNDKS